MGWQSTIMHWLDSSHVPRDYNLSKYKRRIMHNFIYEWLLPKIWCIYQHTLPIMPNTTHWVHLVRVGLWDEMHELLQNCTTISDTKYKAHPTHHHRVMTMPKSSEPNESLPNNIWSVGSLWPTTTWLEAKVPWQICQQWTQELHIHDPQNQDLLDLIYTKKPCTLKCYH